MRADYRFIDYLRPLLFIARLGFNHTSKCAADLNFLSLLDLQLALGTDFGCLFDALGLGGRDHFCLLDEGGLLSELLLGSKSRDITFRLLLVDTFDLR